MRVKKCPKNAANARHSAPEYAPKCMKVRRIQTSIQRAPPFFGSASLRLSRISRQPDQLRISENQGASSLAFKEGRDVAQNNAPRSAMKKQNMSYPRKLPVEAMGATDSALKPRLIAP